MTSTRRQTESITPRPAVTRAGVLCRSKAAATVAVYGIARSASEVQTGQEVRPNSATDRDRLAHPDRRSRPSVLVRPQRVRSSKRASARAEGGRGVPHGRTHSAANRYPTPGSVSRYRGRAGSPSFRRSPATNTRRVCVSWATPGPHTSLKRNRWVSTLPACFIRVASSLYYRGVRWTSAPARVTSRAARSSDRSPTATTGSGAGRAACRRAVRIRASSSPSPNGLVT